MSNNIIPDLQPLATPIDDLISMAGNPRKGDIDAIAKSYKTFGQRKPIVVKRNPDRPGSGVVLAGNHQLAAAKQLGWTEIAVVWVEDDEQTAKAYAVADNSVGLLGDWDVRALLDSLNGLPDDLLSATSFTLDDIDDFEAMLEELTNKPFFPAAKNKDATDQEVDNSGEEGSYADRLDRYLVSATRQFVFEYPLETYQWAAEQLALGRKALGSDSNADLLLALLRNVKWEDMK